MLRRHVPREVLERAVATRAEAGVDALVRALPLAFQLVGAGAFFVLTLQRQMLSLRFFRQLFFEAANLRVFAIPPGLVPARAVNITTSAAQLFQHCFGRREQNAAAR